jgi:hypothetical protein
VLDQVFTDLRESLRHRFSGPSSGDWPATSRY